MEDSYIYGVNVNGVSVKITKLSFETDQSAYDYICNVDRTSQYNGNGVYDIVIVDSNYAKGCSIGMWRILSARIKYNWGNASSCFVLSDQYGEKTYDIEATTQPCNRNGYDIDSLVRAIFSKARDVISEYPSAVIYNKFSDFLKLNNELSNTRCIFREENNRETLNAFFKNSYRKIVEYIDYYKELSDVLSENKDSKSIQLLSEIETMTLKFIEKHFV